MLLIVALRVSSSSNLPVSYVLTGNLAPINDWLPVIYHIIYFLVISKYISVISLN